MKQKRNYKNETVVDFQGKSKKQIKADGMCFAFAVIILTIAGMITFFVHLAKNWGI